MNISLPVELFRVSILKHKRPFVVNFNITYRCPLKCNYCPVHKYNTKYLKEREMTTEQIFSMIDELSGIGMKRLAIGGGEPLLREDIGEIIRHAKKKNIIVYVISSGCFIPKRIKDLVDVDVLFVSLDGPEEINDRYRGKNSFKNTIKAIEAAKEHGINTVVNMTITKNSYDCIDFFEEKSKELGFHIAIEPLTYSEPTDKVDLNCPSSEEYQRIINKLIRKKLDGMPILNSISFLRYSKKMYLNGKYMYGWPIKKNLECWGGRSFCSIDPYGNISPCYIFYEFQKFLNGLENGFANAFRRLSDITCDRCLFYGPTEFKMNMSLDFNSLSNSIKIFTKKFNFIINSNKSVKTSKSINH